MDPCLAFQEVEECVGTCDVDQEPTSVEAPQRSPAIRPGHLWQNDTAETMQSALKGVRVASQEVSEEILLVLKHQHSEVMQRLEWQDQVLREMKEGKVEGRRCSTGEASSLKVCQVGRPLENWQGATSQRHEKSPLMRARAVGIFTTTARVDGLSAAPAARLATWRRRSVPLERYVAPAQRRVGHTPLAVLRVVGLALILVTLGLFVVFPVVSVGMLVKKDPGRKWVDLVICAWAKMTISPFFRVKIKGHDNLPKDEACVYVANHQSFMDILSVYQLFKPFKFVSKASILKIPLVGWAMRRAKTITIEREDRRSQLNTFRECVEALKKGTSIFVFPEGTRSSDGKLLKFKRGPVSIAKRAKVPIVPLTILGTGRLMPAKKEYLLYQNNCGVKLVVHPMISAKEVQETPDDELLQRLRDTIDASQPPQLQTMPVPSPTKRAVPDAAVVERLFRPLANYPVVGTFESIDADLKDGAATVDEKEAARKKRQQSFVSTNAEKGCLVKLTTHPWFDIFFAGVVICNSIFVGVEVSHTIYYKGDTGPFLEVVRYIFAVIFTLELILRISAGGKIFFTSDEWMWNWLDCFIVFTSIWEIVNDLVLQELFKGSDGVTFTGLKALRLVRITRIVKVARLARVLRFVMALRTLISSIIYTLKSLIWAMILLGLIVYDTMLSLFMSIAGGVSWEEVVRPLKAISTAWVFVFLFYIAFTYFAVLNVVTGVFCQSAIDSAQNDQTLVLQSILATKQANIEKIRHLSPGQKDQLVKGNISCETWSSTNGDVNPLR
ncbi:unnamed protein product [Cladocopium goreaui]|uniref:1-acyl-sn-glycerol-3-phosphate acyltransferase n=1 Tax=Cladocopium goreaui TaxID=2562237 RepID=A0A9P1DSM4_9DINO|nr:unnamed protein product [Cladocopium goreaui]